MNTFRTIAIIIAGLVCLVVGCIQLINGARSSKWPNVEGTVVATDVKEHRSRRGGKSYSPEVQYQYSVNGASYASSRMSYGDAGSSSSMEGALKTLGNYPVGKKISVYYNPSEPSTAVLVPGITSLSYLFPAIGVCMLSIGLFTARRLFRA